MTETVPPLSADARTRLVAIAMMCSAVLCFTLIDTTAKALTPKLGLVATTWLRYVAAFLMISVIINPWRTPGLLKSNRFSLQALRSGLLFASTITNFIALQYLQLAQTVSINFLAPLMFVLLAGPVLGEWAGPRRIAAVAVGFVGVLIVTRPGFGAVHPAVLLSFISACCYTSVLLVTRGLARYDSTETTLFYSTVSGVILLVIPALWLWQAQIGLTEVGLIVLCGFGAAAGHWLMIHAQRLAPASVLAPFIYSQIVWMLLAGYLFFGEVPDLWTFVGGAVVVASGLYILHRERVQRADPPPSA